MHNPLLISWAQVSVQVAFWVCVAWPFIVRTFWPWNRDEWGWNMVIKTWLIAVALFPYVLQYEFAVRRGLALQWVVVIAVTLIPLVIAWRTWIIWQAQVRGARRREERRRRQIPGSRAARP